MRKHSILCIFLLLSGCASNLPVVIQQAPISNPAVSQVQEDSGSYVGQYVRWGGTIIGVENKHDSTWVEVLARPLNHFGRPITYYDEYLGRFIVRVDGFLEPEQYKKDREFTVYGLVESKLARKLDEHLYEYPLIYAKEHYLWNERRYIHHPSYYAGHYPFYRHYYRYPFHLRHYHRFHFGRYY